MTNIYQGEYAKEKAIEKQSDRRMLIGLIIIGIFILGFISASLGITI